MSKITIGRRSETERGVFRTPRREVYVYFGKHNNSQFGAGICVIPPKSNNERHAHNDGDEVIYVIDGEMKIFVEDESVVLKKGDAVLIRKGQMHQIFNNSETEELVHTFTFYPSDSADLIKKGYGRSSEDYRVYQPGQEVDF